MLFIVLLLLLAALGLVVAALVTANSLWAWLSIGLSALAGLLLTVEWWRRRSTSADGAHVESETAAGGSESETAAVGAESGMSTEEPGAESTEELPEPDSSAVSVEDGSAPTEVESDSADPGDSSRQGDGQQQTALLPASGRIGDDEDPPEEPTDAADLLLVAELDVEVQVVDERPRYHLSSCRWVADRDTIPVPAKEARELGFTPCAWCGPDAQLAEEHRGKRVPGNK